MADETMQLISANIAGDILQLADSIERTISPFEPGSNGLTISVVASATLIAASSRRSVLDP